MQMKREAKFFQCFQPMNCLLTCKQKTGKGRSVHLKRISINVLSLLH
jgi:hypothetical protein